MVLKRMRQHMGPASQFTKQLPVLSCHSMQNDLSMVYVIFITERLLSGSANNLSH